MTLITMADQTSCFITGARAERPYGKLHNNVYTGGAFGPILPAGWSLIDVSDFNRDGNNDYALFNSSTRQTAIWTLSGTMLTGGAWGPILSRTGGHL